MENLLDSMFYEIDLMPQINIALRTNPIIGTIISRDSVVIDGKRPRLRAKKELAYIYYMANRSILTSFTEEARSERSRIRVGLPKDWKPDELILQAIEEIKEDSVTLTDKLLDSARLLAEDFLNLIKSMRENSKRLENSFKKDLDTLTPEELDKRTTEIKAAKEEITKFADMFKNVTSVIEQIDTLADKRKADEARKAKRQLSITETDYSLYDRKPEIDE